MLTFKHFLDRPSWAAAAGYDFNFIDCLSHAARRFGFVDVLTLMDEFLEIEIREILWRLPICVIAFLILMAWPLIFWISATSVYVKCRLTKRKYGRGEKPRQVQINLCKWLEDCEWRERRGQW
jgi:hypothetical protein